MEALAIERAPRRLHMGPCLLFVLASSLAAPMAAAQIGGPLLFTVGSDAACSHNTLAGAVLAAANNPGADFIRIAKNHTDASIAVRIVNQQVTVEGGFDDCGDSTASGQTTIDGAGGSASSVIEIDTKPASGNNDADVLLRNLVIRGGENDAGGADLGGGGIEISGGMDVRLEGVTVRNNDSLRGGGILVRSGGSSIVIAAGSIVGGQNTALEGGGIYCANGFAGVIGSRVAGNNAETLGGGVVATQGCLFQLAPGDGVLSNDAEQGGGIYANEGGRVDLLGDETGPARVASNRALNPGDLSHISGRGGGIYASDTGTEVRAENAHIVSNSAKREQFGAGGGVMVQFGASFRMERTLGADCHTPDRCSSLSGNVGGALAMGSGAVVIHGTYIENNGPFESVAPTLEMFVGDLSTEGVVIANNGPGPVLRKIPSSPGGSARFAFTTFASNLVPDGDPMMSIEAGGHVSIYSSVLAEQTGDLLELTGGATADLDCLIVNDDSSLPGGTRIVELPFTPFFVDAANGDYHLLPTSLNPAIDFCDDAVAVPAFADIDLEARGVNEAAVRPGRAPSAPLPAPWSRSWGTAGPSV
jgi:hypothetical protein